MALPGPITVTDEYLRAIHGVLGEIRDRLPAAQPQPTSGPMKVAEPAKPAPRKRAGHHVTEGKP